MAACYTVQGVIRTTGQRKEKVTLVRLHQYSAADEQESRRELSSSSSDTVDSVGDSGNTTKCRISVLVESRFQVGQRNASAGASIGDELDRFRDELRESFDVGHVKRCLMQEGLEEWSKSCFG